MTIEELEEIRKELQKKNKKNNIISVVVILATIALFISIAIATDSTDIKDIAEIVAIGIFTLVIVISGIILLSRLNTSELREKFNREYKKKYILKPLENTFTNLEYNPEKGIKFEDIDSTYMVNFPAMCSNDLISGKYKNTNFIQSDVIVSAVGVPEEYNPTLFKSKLSFKGKWMIFDFDKDFKVNMVVYEKKLEKLLNVSILKKYKKIETEAQILNEKYKIYAQDEQEAFYILTPKFIEVLKELATDISGDLVFLFVKNKLHVGINNNRDSFEHDINEKLDENKIINEYSKDIKLITDFIDALDIDNNDKKKLETL